MSPHTAPRSPARVLAALLGAMCGAAHAQPVTAPPEIADVFSVEAGLDMAHHDNVFRTQGGPSDTVVRAQIGLRLDRVIGLQRVELDAFVSPVRYLQYSDYNYIGYGLGAAWHWAAGRAFFGDVLVRAGRDQTAFELVGAYANNLQTLASVRVLGGMRLTQAWSAIAALDQTHSSNSLFSLRAADYSRTGVEVGTRYAPETALEMDLVWRHEQANYPYRQVFDSTGALLPEAVDNAYTQDSPLVRLGYRPTDVTRLVGQLGYTRRRYDNVPQRDFNGITTAIDAEWPMSGATTMRAGVLRSIEVAELPTANYVDVRGLAVRPFWQVTARSRIDAVVALSMRRYLGDPATVTGTTPVREDRVQQFGLEWRYQIGRRTWVSASMRQLTRSSNYSAYDFTDRWVGVGLQASF
jgi:hypothetical protein